MIFIEKEKRFPLSKSGTDRMLDSSI